MEYEFKLSFKLGNEIDHDSVMLSLAEAGCTDALVGLGISGHISLEFIREAASAKEAIQSALQDVKKALPHARLIEASPDYVGLTDVADWVGMSRQNMRKLMLTHAGQFPSPVHEGSTSIWHFKEVLDFLKDRQVALSQSVLDVAQTTMQINLVNEQQKQKGTLGVRFERLLKSAS